MSNHVKVIFIDESHFLFLSVLVYFSTIVHSLNFKASSEISRLSKGLWMVEAEMTA